jgi:hypothetical protein
MESPTTIVKSAIQPGTIIKGIVGALIVFAIFDLLGFTDYILRPVTALKARFAGPAA